MTTHVTCMLRVAGLSCWMLRDSASRRSRRFNRSTFSVSGEVLSARRQMPSLIPSTAARTLTISAAAMKIPHTQPDWVDSVCGIYYKDGKDASKMRWRSLMTFRQTHDIVSYHAVPGHQCGQETRRVSICLGSCELKVEGGPSSLCSLHLYGQKQSVCRHSHQHAHLSGNL